MPRRNTQLPESSWNLLGEDAGEMFHRFCHTWSAKVSPENPLPKTAAEWLAVRDVRRNLLRKAMGLPEMAPCPLLPEVTGVEDRGDYILEKTLLRSRPNLVMTTHLYLPKDSPKPAPAILSVHGHWGNGKLNEVVQSRNIGMAKLGFVVLCVDAIGSSERAYQGEMYHGRQLGAQGFPAGLTLAGLQVWDNMRGLDYLCSRPEVDSTRIACTGASGGCNQTLYLAALDERVAAAAPVCCIGSLEGYLNGAHCVCEMIPGIKQLAEMVDVLSLIAPRLLILINGIHDGGAGFQIDDMRAQFPKLKRVYELLGAGDKVAKSEIDLGHGYFPAMREVMYAWFRKWLMGIEADLCPDPEVEPVAPESLWCFPDGNMPEQYDDVPSLVYEEGQRLQSAYPSPSDILTKREATLTHIEIVLGGVPHRAEPEVVEPKGGEANYVITSECGVEVPMVISGSAEKESCLLWLSTQGKASVLDGTTDMKVLKDSEKLAVPDLRGLGETAWAKSDAAGVWDYQLFQNGIMLGRPILGMWVWDALQCLKVLHDRYESVSVGGQGVMAMVALFAAAFDEKVEAVRCENLLSSYVYPHGFAREHPMSLFVPNLLKYADVPQIAALVAPRKLRVVRAVDGGNRELTTDQMAEAFRYGTESYRAAGVEGNLALG